MKKTVIILLSCILCNVTIAQNTYTLEQILDSARQNNIAMLNGQRDVAIASEQRKEAFTKYFPTISGTGAWFNANKSLISADINPSNFIPSTLATQLPTEALSNLSSPIGVNLVKNGFLGGITAVQPVFAGGRIVNSNKLASVVEDASQLQLHLSENDVDKTAEKYYWQIVDIEEKLRTVASMEELLADIHKDVDISVQAGVALHNDLLQVELRQNNVESQKLTLNNQLSLARMLLAQYCGMDDTEFLVSYNAEADGPSSLKCDHQQVLRQTTEYKLLDKQVEVVKFREKLMIGEYLPSVGVGVGYTYSDIIDKSQNRAMVFATVSVPLSDWWGGNHAIRRRKIEYKKALAEQQDKSQLLLIRMQHAWNDVEEAYKQLTIAERSIEQSAENLRLNRDFYNAGTTQMSDLLEAQLLYQQALDKRTDMFTQYQNNILIYKQSTGM